ncbi:MAG: hypothetical protein HY348_05880 [Nitrospira defluvii]|nr:hypothetical protein [Nitrospira defluvii]
MGYGGEVTILKNIVLGYGGEVLSSTPTFEATGPVGSITMNPGSSFAALDADPNGTVQTIPAPASIQTPAESQKIVQPSLVKVVTAPVLSTLSPDLFLQEGETKSITISLNKPAEIQETVSLTNSNPGAATISPIGPITFKPGEQTSQPVQVTGVKQGFTVITATLRNVPKSANVVVNPLPTPSGQSQSPALPPGTSNTVDTIVAIQYPKVLATSQVAIAAPRLLTDKCAGVKDGQFSSFAQINRDSAPPQPGRYLSAPIVLETEQVVGAQEVMPEISFMVGPPKLLTVKPEAMVFTALGENCGR